MSRRIIRSITSIALAYALAAGHLSLAGHELTPSARPHVLIDAISGALDAIGIDTVRGDTAAVALDRPRVARLVTLPAPPAGYTAPWMDDFVRGFTGMVVGVSGAGASSPTDEAEFTRVWNSVVKNRRVFLSFTRADVAQAHQVADVLRSRGFVTFVYLNGEGGVKFGTDVVGRLFREAGQHLVLDTLNARRSPGVWLEARLAKLTAGKEELYVPVRESTPEPAPQAGGAAGGAPGGAASSGRPEARKYRAPQMPVDQLRASPKVFREAGGIMFGRAATPGAGVPRASAPGLRYDPAALNGRRLVADFGHGMTVTVAGIQDALLLPTAAFVQDGRPVVVNMQGPKGTGACAANPGRLGLVELHPAFVDTSAGVSLIRADTMVWPVVNEYDVNARGERFVLDRLSPSVKTTVDALRELYAVGRPGKVSNINDVERPARFSVIGREVRLEGLPRIEILDEYETRKGPGVALLPELSEPLTTHQAALFAVADKPAYDMVVSVYRLAGFLNYIKNANAEGWRAFVTTLPATRRGMMTPTIVCARCSSDTLFKWLADCPAVSGR